MPFCPICKGNHDPSFPCSQQTLSALHEAGIDIEPEPRPGLKGRLRAADRAFLVVMAAMIVAVGAYVAVKALS